MLIAITVCKLLRFKRKAFLCHHKIKRGWIFSETVPYRLQSMPDQQINHVYPAGLIAMAVRTITLLQRISLDLGPCKCTFCVCLCMCLCAEPNTFLVYVAFSLCCINFSLDLWEGKVLCIRPSLAWAYIGAHWHTYVGACH